MAGLLATLWIGCSGDDAQPGRSGTPKSQRIPSSDSLLVLCLSSSESKDAVRSQEEASNSLSGRSYSPECQQQLQDFNPPLSRRFQPFIRTNLQQAAGMQKKHPVLVVGTPKAVGVVPKLDSILPVALTDSVLTVHGRRYSSPTDVLLAHGPSPWNPEQSAYLALASKREEVVRYADGGLPFSLSQGSYRIIQDRRLTAAGQLEDSQGPPGPARQHRSLRGDGPAIETEHLRIYAVDESGFTEERIRNIASRRERVRRRVQSLLGSGSSTLKPIDYYLFADAQSLGTLGVKLPPKTVMTFPAPRFTRWNARRRYVDVVPGRSRQLSYPRDAVVWARDLRSRPATPLLEVGVAVVSEQGSSDDRLYRRRAARIREAGLVPPLDSLLSQNWREGSSPLLVEPLAGTFVDFLLDRWGREEFRQRYASWRLRKADSSSFRKDWRRYLETLDYVQRHSHQPSGDDSSVPDRPFREGLTIAHPNGPVKSPNGYASPAADSSQADARRLGANAIAIVPYTEVPAADTAVAVLPRRHKFDGETKIIGGESDASIAHAIRDAHRRDLTVMLKPQFGSHVEWPGAIRMDSEEEWDRFFRAYRRWIVHYALLAQRYDVEQLAIGTELVYAVRERPSWWRETIQQMRHVYDGSLTYAAHWENVNEIAFWDALDVIGVNAYAPLSEKESPSDSALVAGAEDNFQQWADLHRRTGRPVVLTEAGASSRGASWKAPYAEREDRPVRPHDQARTYTALIEAMEDKAWIRGVYWWRWPVSSPKSGPFDIRNQPAADTLHEWYGGSF